jgi:hypothetical protein
MLHSSMCQGIRAEVRKTRHWFRKRVKCLKKGVKGKLE